MYHRTLGLARPRTLAATAALAACMLFARPASASTSGSPCSTAGHPATTVEIISNAQAQAAVVHNELSWMQPEYDNASPASPAQWRLREELDRLHALTLELQDLQATAFIRGDATPGSPAQFRAQEELDMLCSVA